MQAFKAFLKGERSHKRFFLRGLVLAIWNWIGRCHCWLPLSDRSRVILSGKWKWLLEWNGPQNTFSKDVARTITLNLFVEGTTVLTIPLHLSTHLIRMALRKPPLSQILVPYDIINTSDLFWGQWAICELIGWSFVMFQVIIANRSAPLPRSDVHEQLVLRSPRNGHCWCHL